MVNKVRDNYYIRGRDYNITFELKIFKMVQILALKWNEIPTHDTMWMDLEDIMLSEISQSQKDKYCITPPI